MNQRSTQSYRVPVNIGQPGFAIPYIAIIFIGVLFWPLGLILLIIKLNSDRKSLLLAAGIVSLVGWGLLIIGLMAVLGFSLQPERVLNSSTDVAAFVVSVLMFTGGIALLVTGHRLKKNAKRYKQYIAIVWNDGVTEFGRIAKIVSRPYDTVKKDLQRIIDHKLLPDGYIDHGEGKIVLPGLTDEDEEEIIDVVSCKNCGAHKKIKVGTIAVCDFCGSKLKVGA